jgi:hypothetical protein
MTAMTPVQSNAKSTVPPVIFATSSTSLAAGRGLLGRGDVLGRIRDELPLVLLAVRGRGADRHPVDRVLQRALRAVFAAFVRAHAFFLIPKCGVGPKDPSGAELRSTS